MNWSETHSNQDPDRKDRHLSPVAPSLSMPLTSPFLDEAACPTPSRLPRRAAAEACKLLFPLLAARSDSHPSQLLDSLCTSPYLARIAAGVETVTLRDIQSDPRVPRDDPLRSCRNAVLVPVQFGTGCDSSGVLLCVDKLHEPFGADDEAILAAVAACAGNVLHKSVLIDAALAAQRKASALLDMASAARHIREDSHVNLPSLIERIMLSVYRVMRADRVSLYLCDNRTRELWCCISKDYKGARIPFGVGIIGTVANHGVMLNIRDCYQDRRFDRHGDRVTGYLTRSMLAAPLFSSAGDLVAVLVVINKLATPGSIEPILPPLAPAAKRPPLISSQADAEADSSELEEFEAKAGSPTVNYAGHLTLKISAASASTRHAAATNHSTHRLPTEIRADRTSLQGPAGHHQIQSLAADDFDPADLDPCEVAGITFFTKEDEMILESIGTEIGNILERNAIDALYESVINEVVNHKPRDLGKILTASMLAETTNSEVFHSSVAVFSNSDSPTLIKEPRHAQSFRRKTPSSASLSHTSSTAGQGPSCAELGTPPISASARAGVVLALRHERSKVLGFRLMSQHAYFFRAVGIFARKLRRLRGFQFSVQALGKYECLRGRNAAENRRRIKSVTRRATSTDALERVSTKLCPGAQYVIDTDTSASAVTVPAETIKQSQDWCLNVFSLEPQYGPHLVRLAFKHLGLFEHFSMSSATVMRMVHAIKSSYLPRETCPYHNWDHALGVFQMTFALLCQTQAKEVLTMVDQLALCVGALGHDAGHEGRNNEFEVKIGSDLALRYNDRSVLEQHHAALLFQILRHPGNNILHVSRRSVQSEFRKMTIEAILATDMSSHMSHVKKIASRLSGRASPAARPDELLTRVFSRENAEDRIDLVNFCLHCIDIGGQCYPHDQSEQWSHRLVAEFIAQAADERQLGFEPAPHMMSLENPLRHALLQKSFTENVVRPAWALMCRLFPQAEQLVGNLDLNIHLYNKQIAELQATPASPATTTA